MPATINDVETTIEAIRKVNKDINNYYWMSRKVSQMEAEQFEAAAQISQYGDDSTMPKPDEISDPTYGEVQKKMRVEERNRRFLEKIKRLENAVSQLDDERERLIIEGCMDKVTLRATGQVLSISRQATFEIKESAVRKLAVIMYLND
ncbi:DNA-directed RNA polymerase specialized sigma subunit [Salibacterium salarium]|uniref:hypothetical protein n=1 Tax=Salibacterium salarium TaxID=284579 RepID=UPI002780E221|nr:hypothetical protein [Salibacterium salarium]MDQ0299658.1 DNA-directed RNA polymerase specialized sigma subunit [Salibacterium salarium]